MSKYAQMVGIDTIAGYNAGLSSAKENSMIAALGSPEMPLTTHDQPGRASPRVKALLVTRKVAPGTEVTGIKPAVDHLEGILGQVGAAEPHLLAALGSAGMLNVRLRKPTSHRPSKKISNHAWGTAIDFNIDGGEAPGDTGAVVPLGIAILVPFFNIAGWYWGYDFADTMHFEVADQTVKSWKKAGVLD